MKKSKIRHDVKKFVMTKTRHDIKNLLWRQKHAMTSKSLLYVKTRRDVKILAPILHFYDVSSPSYQRLCVFHKFGDFNNRPIPVVV